MSQKKLTTAGLDLYDGDGGWARAVLEDASVAIVVVDSAGTIVLVNNEAEEMFGYTRDTLVGQPLEMLLPKPVREDHVQHRAGYFRAPQPRPMGLGLDLAGRRKDGTEFPIEVALSTAETEHGTLAVSFITDITERKRAQAKLAEYAAELEQRVAERTREIERRQHVAEGLRDVVTLLNSNQPLDDILDSIVAQAGRLLEPDAVAIYRLDQEAQWLTVQSAYGLTREFVDAVQVPVGAGAVGRAVQERQAVTISDVLLSLKDIEGVDQWNAQQRAHISRLIARYHAVLAVPLIVKGARYGGLSLYYRDPRTFSDDEVDLTATFGDQAALAIENARLRSEAEKAAMAAERSRLARDLHDAVTQTLFSASLIAEVLPRLWDRDPEQGRSRLEELRQLTRGALAEMRTLLLELRPAALTEAPLGDLVRQLTEAMTGRARIPVNYSRNGECAPPPAVQIAFYRITQEALNNIVRHAGAETVDVELHCDANRVALHVTDDGRGFEPESVSSQHLGVSIMRERASAIGADLTIESELGQGTCITVEWTQQDGEESNR